MVLNDLPQPVNQVVFLRGNPGNQGPAVPRQFLSALSGSDSQPFQKGSGRLELAQRIADAKNPLTARVIVNRIWLHHFGHGLVRTPSDFGLRSDPPTHPELLDYLAEQFVRSGWSVKAIHRLILRSATYQQSSADRPELQTTDPENRWLARFPRRRMDFEAMRDSMLAVAGVLEPTMGGPSVELTKEPYTHRRTVYGYIERQNLPGMFRAFDFANPDTHSPQRFSTTVPQQALFLMNSGLVRHVADALVRRPDVSAVTDPEIRIRTLHRLMFHRAPTSEEARLGQRFIDQAHEQAWQRYAQMLLLTNEFAFVE